MANRDEIWTIGSILKWTEQYFTSKGVSTPRLDAEVLLSHVLGKERIYLYVSFDQPLQAEELAAFREMVKRRAKRVPVAYILGEKEFMGLDFMVTPDVLVPRPDTEILVEAVINRMQGKEHPNIADIGTGSGAIIVAVLKNCPEALGSAVDISAAALRIARQNAARHGVEERLAFYCGDLYAPLAGSCFDVIVSNPPYIPEAEIACLQPEVLTEPRNALAGGQDGLGFYRRLLTQGAMLLNQGGFLALEVGYDQAAAVQAIGEKVGAFAPAERIKDYGDIERVIIFKKRE